MRKTYRELGDSMPGHTYDDILTAFMDEIAAEFFQRLVVMEKKIEIVASHMKGGTVEVMDDDGPGGYSMMEITLNQTDQWKKLEERKDDEIPGTTEA